MHHAFPAYRPADPSLYYPYFVKRQIFYESLPKTAIQFRKVILQWTLGIQIKCIQAQIVKDETTFNTI